MINFPRSALPVSGPEPLRLLTPLLAVAMIALSLIMVGPVPDAAAADPVRIVVVGDSYSAGDGAGDYAGPASCFRSKDNYGHQYARLLDRPSTVVTAACSSAGAADIFRPQADRDVPAQREMVGPETDLIMLTIGGNDADFGDVVTYCLVGYTAVSTLCDRALDRSEAFVRGGRFAEMVTNVLLTLGDRAPNAKIVLVGYPHMERYRDPAYVMPGPISFLPRRGRVEVGSRVRALAARADAVDSSLVERLGGRYQYVSTIDTFAGHELYGTCCQHQQTNAPDRWLGQPGDPTVPAGIYHPNPTGWREEAELLHREVRLP